MAYDIEKLGTQQKAELYQRNFIFPGGEVHVEVHPYWRNVQPLCFRLRNSDDIMRMLLTADAIKRVQGMVCDAFIPYVPYARQDRVAVEREPLSIAVMANLINSCGFNEVTVFDPHSDVALALIDDVKVMSHRPCVQESMRLWAFNALVCPDAGARKKIGAFRDLGPIVYCDKKRDPATGLLSGFEVHQESVPESVLIVDDICDGGGTFIGLAQELRAKGANRVGLYVSHGIFSKGLECLRDGGIDHVFTTDSYCTLPSDEFLRVFPICRYEW